MIRLASSLSIGKSLEGSGREITRNDVSYYGKCDYLAKNMTENVIFIKNNIRKCDFLLIFAAENVILRI
jgi:hypothetical protein